MTTSSWRCLHGCTAQISSSCINFWNRLPAKHAQFRLVFELVSSSHTPGGWAQKRALAGARTCPHCL